MTDGEGRYDELRAKIEAAPDPPARDQRRGLRGLARWFSIQATRVGAWRQLEINRGLVAELQRTRESHAGLDAAVAELRQGQRGQDELREWLTNLQGGHEALSHQVAQISERLPSDSPLHGRGTIELETFDAGLGGKVLGFRDRPRADAGAGVYLGFEDYFRGPEAEISQRQRTYLPLLTDREPVLDIGCGRGELLELLAQSGIRASGVDADAGMVEHCRRKGLEVQLADAGPYLRELGDGSLGAIVALQVIEHLPYEQLVDLLRTSVTKLRPAGRLVLETVNPHCPQALKHFWIDPTHQHPLYPEIVLALCGLVGFAGAFIWHPQGVGDPERDRRRELDYAVVAQMALSGP
ncbi:MAG: class I SAM-dependent methyltransferase [Solirubrobacteraceae bacterium]